MGIYPPAWIQTRKSVKECNIGGINIPVGSRIIVSSYLTHRHPDFWRDPETFNPLIASLKKRLTKALIFRLE
jgi:cytochrome P450